MKAIPANLALRKRCVRYSGEESCAICMNSLPSTKFVTRLPCGHHFHCACIGKWRKRNCPLCRKSFKQYRLHDPRYQCVFRYNDAPFELEDMDDYESYWFHLPRYMLQVNRRVGKSRGVFHQVLRQLRRHIRKLKRRQTGPAEVLVMMLLTAPYLDHDD